MADDRPLQSAGGNEYPYRTIEIQKSKDVDILDIELVTAQTDEWLTGSFPMTWRSGCGWGSSAISLLSGRPWLDD